jgi:hypothetical protein
MGEKPNKLGEKLTPSPLRPSQIEHEFAQACTRVSRDEKPEFNH